MNSVCVFCGSSSGKREHKGAAKTTGQAFANAGIRFIYGGGRVGLMGALADAVLSAGGQVTGVMPRALFEREIAHPRVRDMRIVESMQPLPSNAEFLRYRTYPFPSQHSAHRRYLPLPSIFRLIRVLLSHVFS